MNTPTTLKKYTPSKTPRKSTIKHSPNTLSTKKHRVGVPRLNTSANSSNNASSSNNSSNDELNYFYDYFGPNFLQNCENPEDVRLIFKDDKPLCEQFGLHMQKKVSLISGVYKLQKELDVKDKVNLSPVEIQKLNLLINDRQSAICQDTMTNTYTVNADIEAKVINLLATVYNVNIIRGMVQKVISQPGINTSTREKIVEYFEDCSDEDYLDATELVKKVITEFYFGKDMAKCILTKEIMTLLKIIGAIMKLIEQHKIPQPTSNVGSNNNQNSSRSYLHDLLQYSINELSAKLEQFDNIGEGYNQKGGRNEILVPDENITYKFNDADNNDLQNDFVLATYIYQALTQVMKENRSGKEIIKNGLATIFLLTGGIAGAFYILPLALLAVSGIETGRLTKKQLKIFMKKGHHDTLELIDKIKDKFIDSIELLTELYEKGHITEIELLHLLPERTKQYLLSSYEDINKEIKDKLKKQKLDKKLYERLLMIVNYKNTYEIHDDIKYLMVEFMINKLLSTLNYNKCFIKIIGGKSASTEITKTNPINSFTSLMRHLDWLFTSIVYYKISNNKACYYINYFTDEIKEKYERQYKLKNKTNRIVKLLDCVEILKTGEHPENIVELNFTNYGNTSEA